MCRFPVEVVRSAAYLTLSLLSLWHEPSNIVERDFFFSLDPRMKIMQS